MFKKCPDLFGDSFEIAQFALPNLKNVPSQFFQFAPNATIPCYILFKFLHPESDSRFWCRGISASCVTMPKASVYENDLSPRRKDEIRTSRQTFIVKAESIAHAVNKATDRQFGRCVLRANRRHDERTLFRRDFIHMQGLSTMSQDRTTSYGSIRFHRVQYRGRKIENQSKISRIYTHEPTVQLEGKKS